MEENRSEKLRHESKSIICMNEKLQKKKIMREIRLAGNNNTTAKRK